MTVVWVPILHELLSENSTGFPGAHLKEAETEAQFAEITKSKLAEKNLMLEWVKLPSFIGALQPIHSQKSAKFLSKTYGHVLRDYLIGLFQSYETYLKKNPKGEVTFFVYSSYYSPKQLVTIEEACERIYRKSGKKILALSLSSRTQSDKKSSTFWRYTLKNEQAYDQPMLPTAAMDLIVEDWIQQWDTRRTRRDPFLGFKSSPPNRIFHSSYFWVWVAAVFLMISFYYWLGTSIPEVDAFGSL